MAHPDNPNVTDYNTEDRQSKEITAGYVNTQRFPVPCLYIIQSKSFFSLPVSGLSGVVPKLKTIQSNRQVRNV